MDISKVFDRLFPLNRAVTGTGLRETLRIINEYVPLEIIEIPSGTNCFGWEIPKEWWIRGAYLENRSGEKIVDFKNHNLHVLSYCAPYNGWVGTKELLQHVYSLPEQPEAIPYITSVYEERWGFCLSDKQKITLTDDAYYVNIDSGFMQGTLSIGEGIVKGRTEKEITLFTYTGHPSMANDQLSGILTSMLVYEWLLRNKDRLKFTYRILFCPETIGTAAYLSQNLMTMKEHFHAGFMLTFLGDSSPIRYKKSLEGNSQGDRAAQNIMRNRNIVEYDADGSDERHFNAPGIDLPFGTFMRAGPYGYDEYHTSLDNQNIVDESQLIEASETVIKTIKNLEANRKIDTLYRGFEPKLDTLGLYPTLGKKFEHKTDVTQMLRVWRFSSACEDIIEIGDRMQVDAYELEDSCLLAEKIKLIKRSDNDY